MDGFGKGAGNILKGVLGGAAIMVTAPIKGKYVRACRFTSAFYLQLFSLYMYGGLIA